jgi:hypothetical protein
MTLTDVSTVQGINTLLYVFATEENVVQNLIVNTIKFAVKESPQLVYPLVFQIFLNNLRVLGIHAFPHHNKLYMVFERGDQSLLEFLNDEVKDFVDKMHLQNMVEYNLAYFDTEKLAPVNNPSHFVIFRSLLYSYLRNFFSNKIQRAQGTLKFEKLEEGLRILIDCEDMPEGSSSQYLLKICQGLRFLLEVTQKQRAMLWVDLITIAIKIDQRTGRVVSLSSTKLKEISDKVYLEYLYKAKPSPKNRAELIEDYLQILGIKDSLTVPYHMYIPEADSFDRVELRFERVKAV